MSWGNVIRFWIILFAVQTFSPFSAFGQIRNFDQQATAATKNAITNGLDGFPSQSTVVAKPAGSGIDSVGGGQLQSPEFLSVQKGNVDGSGIDAINATNRNYQSYVEASKAQNQILETKDKAVQTGKIIQTGEASRQGNQTALNQYMGGPAENFPQFTRTQFKQQLPKMIEEFDEAIEKTESYKQHYARETAGNYNTAMQLGQQSLQLGKAIQGLQSDPQSFGGATVKDSGTVDNFTANRAQGATIGAGINTQGAQVAALPANTTKTKDESIVDVVPPKPAGPGLVGNIGEVKDDKEMKKFLANQLVPEAFVKDLEKKLAAISNDKEALAIIQEMGKQAGVDELANLTSLDQLAALEAQANDPTHKKAGEAGATPAALDGYFAEGGKGQAKDEMTDEDAEIIKSVQGVLASVTGKDENGNRVLLIDSAQNAASDAGATTSGEITKRRALASGEGSDGIGGPGADMFQRARKANHKFYQKHYMRTANLATPSQS